MMRPFNILLLVAVAIVALPSLLPAAYDFEFTTYDYATEVWYFETAHFEIRVENTGTEPDTVDLKVVDKSLPLGWYTAICINGVCPYPAYVVFYPGQSDTVVIDVYTGDSRGMGTMRFQGTSRGDPGLVKTDGEYAAFCAQSSVLLVDDDNGASYETYLDDALQDAGYYSHVLHANAVIRPDDVRLSSYWAVFWTTADGDASYITTADEQSMMTYLDNGGNLLLASMDFLSSRAGATTFTSDYLHLSGWTGDFPLAGITGAAGDPVGDGMAFGVAGGPFPSVNSDLMNYVSPAVEVFYCPSGSRAIRVDGLSHKVVFLSFPFENIPAALPDPNNQAEVARRVTTWFEPQMGADDDIPELAIDAGRVYNSPNPFSAQTRIKYHLNGAGKVRLSVFTPTGRHVTDLVDGYVEPGTHWVEWNGKDGENRDMGSGIYYYRLAADGKSSTGKMILLR